MKFHMTRDGQKTATVVLVVVVIVVVDIVAIRGRVIDPRKTIAV